MNEPAQPVSKFAPLHHYVWGEGCDGWNLVDGPALSVKQERMPAGTSEAMHRHEHAQQFFFILEGTAHFEIEGKEIKVEKGQGLHIRAGQEHRIGNRGGDDLEFILCSQPATTHDRINSDDKKI